MTNRRTRNFNSDGQLQCTGCKFWKSTDGFHKDKITPTGYSYQCKECKDKCASDWYLRNKARLAEKKAAYGKRRYLALKAAKQPFVDQISHTAIQGKAAKRAVRSAVERHEIPPIATQYCIKCLKQAHHYHHQSYRKEDLLNVIPLCASCHGMYHRRGYPISHGQLGILPTSVGIIRIAFATIST